MTTEAAEAGAGSSEEGLVYCGRVIIEWPAPHNGRALPGWGCSIYDAETGKQIVTVKKLNIPAVTADAKGLITCWLTMFEDPDGKPLLEVERRQRLVTGVFPFEVAEMRVRQP